MHLGLNYLSNDRNIVTFGSKLAGEGSVALIHKRGPTLCFRAIHFKYFTNLDKKALKEG